MNQVQFLIIGFFASFFTYGLLSGQCEIFAPCENKNLKYIAMYNQEGKMNMEDEDLIYTPIGGNAIQFNRILKVTVIGGQNYTSTSNGIISKTPGGLGFPPEYFLPRPITIHDLFTPPTVEYSGSNCMLPNEPALGFISACQNMNLKAYRSASQGAQGNNKASFEANQGLELQISFPSREVMSLSDTLSIEGFFFDCLVIKERSVQTGNFEGTVWEVNWYAKGYGLVQSHYHKTDPGSDFKKTPDIGWKRLKSW